MNNYLVGAPTFAGKRALAYYRISHGHASLYSFFNLALADFETEIPAINDYVMAEMQRWIDEGAAEGSLNSTTVYAQMRAQGYWFDTFDELESYLSGVL